MACDFVDDFEKNIDNLKSTVRQSFSQIYASLKARELKTLRQLDAIRKQCQDNKDLKKTCSQNIRICYENEATLLDSVSRYGAIDLERLNFDSTTFTLQDYICPNDDHMYSYKTIEDLTKEDDLGAIEEAALKQITSTSDCVCNVSIKTENVSKQFRDESLPKKIFCDSCSNVSSENSGSKSSETEAQCSENCTEDEVDSSEDVDMKKIKPTDDWLNSIKNQTETEPSQVTDVMEHSTITCS